MVKDSGVPEQPVASIIGVTVIVDISEAVFLAGKLKDLKLFNQKAKIKKKQNG